MKKAWWLGWGMMALMAAAMAADAPAKPPPVTPEARAKAEAARALAKVRAEDARKHLQARLQKRAERKARVEQRSAARAQRKTADPAPTPAAAPASSPPVVTTRPAPATPTRRPAPTVQTVQTVRATPVTPPPAAPTVTDRVVDAAGLMPPAGQAPAIADTPVQPRKKGIPPGFEEWFAPQKTSVDLYYGGRFLMTTLVEYTLENITFLNPPEIAAKVPGLRDSAGLSVQLAETLPTNSDKTCSRPNQPLCGHLEPATVGVIFDDSRFRADLFVHPSLLLEVERQREQYLPEPAHSAPTLVQNLNALYSGSSAGESRFSLFGRTRLGQGRQHYFANWASTDQNALSVDELGYTRDLKDVQVQAGLFEPSLDALRALPRQPIIGVSVARSLLTRTDLDSIIASPIELFIPVRGRVDIFRDDRLISTGFYEAGNQRIDTSRLPGGAYEIDIVITDITGSTRTLRQLFIKSSLMAPPGEPQWFVDAGQVMRRTADNSFPESFGSTQLRAGYRWRQRQWLGFGTAAALTDEESLVELSAGLLFDWLEGGAELYGSSAGGTGFGLRGLTRWQQLVASANFQQNEADDIAPDDYRLLPSSYTLTSLHLSHPFLQGLFSTSIQQREDAAGNRTQRTTVGYNRTIPLKGHHFLQMQAEIGDDDGNALAMLSLQWRSIRKKWTDSAQVRISQSDAEGNADTVSVGGSTVWQDGDRYVDDVEFGVRAEVGDQNRSVTLEGLHRSQYGLGRASLTSSDTSGSNQTLMSVGYNTSLVVDRTRRMAWGGGPVPGEAGVLLDLSGAPDAQFEVSADGQRHFVARGGRMVALTLPPYHHYRVRLKDNGLNLTQFDDQPRDITLYPGHVLNLDWAITPVQVLIGRVIQPGGQPVANARVEGTEGPAYTDNEGYLQTEISSTVQTLKVYQAGQQCRVTLPSTGRGENVLRAGSLTCAPVTTDATTGQQDATEPQP